MTPAIQLVSSLLTSRAPRVSKTIRRNDHETRSQHCASVCHSLCSLAPASLRALVRGHCSMRVTARSTVCQTQRILVMPSTGAGSRIHLRLILPPLWTGRVRVVE